MLDILLVFVVTHAEICICGEQRRWFGVYLWLFCCELNGGWFVVERKSKKIVVDLERARGSA